MLNKSGFCGDETCPFSEHLQSCPAGWVGHPEKGGQDDVSEFKSCICILSWSGTK